MRFTQRVDKSPLLAIVHETQPPQYFFIGDDSADLAFDPEALPPGWQGVLRWVMAVSARLRTASCWIKREQVVEMLQVLFREQTAMFNSSNM